ncbi:bacterial integral membrane protein-like protein [Naegleria gruberi]|uniref:Bacterial integral membrane protein-like protein n=1 Tax=Naegleria gruberi TaxID=5762 RepID=D2VBC4_NAEGR|nr:bacterial integral membrane protein-like protein [Naegleria gruberi]EFC45883.1 bacterial integral membrane protein-like protein [Naegleria gruberi]|eukprot:XP_002678627.1 bacterial integral membrane protein-like protein [Naegleria gruberi strain NEG-M]
MFTGIPISCPPMHANSTYCPPKFPIEPPSSEPTNKLSIKVVNDSIVFYSAKTSKNELKIKLHRTLRIPDDGKIYPLPPSLGTFPIKRVDDYINKVPESWKQKGGVFVCLHQREAMWMEFENSTNPHALKVAVGKVNALSGEQWDEEIKSRKVQDYCVTPAQKWLDGINNGNGTIKQFIAMPLGQGYTVESQVTGEDKVGGAQIICYNPFSEKAKSMFPEMNETTWSSPKKKHSIIPTKKSIVAYSPPVSQAYPIPTMFSTSSTASIPQMKCCSPAMPRSSLSSLKCEEKRSRSQSSNAQELGLAAGGKMKQDIAKDPYGPSFWDERTKSRVFVHIVNSDMYQQITGEKAPPCPISAKTYSSYKYPWFDHYNENLGTIGESSILSNVKSVKQVDIQKYGYSTQNNQSVKINNVITTKTVWNPNDVRDGDW